MIGRKRLHWTDQALSVQYALPHLSGLLRRASSIRTLQSPSTVGCQNDLETRHSRTSGPWPKVPAGTLGFV